MIFTASTYIQRYGTSWKAHTPLGFEPVPTLAANICLLCSLILSRNGVSGKPGAERPAVAVVVIVAERLLAVSANVEYSIVEGYAIERLLRARQQTSAATKLQFFCCPQAAIASRSRTGRSIGEPGLMNNNRFADGVQMISLLATCEVFGSACRARLLTRVLLKTSSDSLSGGTN